MARESGYANAPLRTCIADGSHWLWRVAEQYFGSAVQILDWYHWAEQVHKAANIVHGEAAEEATPWSKQLKDESSQGHGAAALELVRAQWATVRAPAKQEALQELQTYLVPLAGDPSIRRSGISTSRRSQSASGAFPNEV
jgi:hypothetical protein